MTGHPREGGLYWIDIAEDGRFEAENRGLHPWLVVSDLKNGDGRTLIAVPLTSQAARYDPATMIPLTPAQIVIDPDMRDERSAQRGSWDDASDNIVQVCKLMHFDRSRFEQALYIGIVDKNGLRAVRQRLGSILRIPVGPR